MKNKKIIITGGAGFIGSHLCQKLLQLDNTVICIDNLLTGKKNNITNLFGNKNFTFINHDINYQINIKSDFIFHLACPASPKHYQKDPVNTLITNINGTYNILKLAKNIIQELYLHQLVRFMVILTKIHKKKVIMVMLIQ